jgi:hypothetical protein
MNCEFKGGWGDSEVTDIVSSHMYNCIWGIWDAFADVGLKEGNLKGTMFTEAGARWKGSRRNHAGPTDVMYWLDEHRRKKGKPIPGVMLCWELNVGNSNCRWHWVDNGYKRGKPDPEPEIPWCGMQWPNGDPVSLAEAQIVKKHATGKWEAVFYDDFQRGARQWKIYGTKHLRCKHGLYVTHGVKAIAGDPKWTDYTLEGRVLYARHWKFRHEKGKPPKDYSAVEGEAGAGLMFRVNNPGDDWNEITCYAVSHNTKQLKLWKVVNKEWKELANYDLTERKVTKHAGGLNDGDYAKATFKDAKGTEVKKPVLQARKPQWSMFRVEAVGPRIRVFFNRYHSDPDKGLRIDYTDKDNPILSGSIGMGGYKCGPLFDNVVVVPVKK